MPSVSSRLTEGQIGDIVLRILYKRKDGEAKVSAIPKRFPTEYKLSLGDQAGSITRVHEELWEQQLRNLKSHHKTDKNPFKEGYITNPSRGIWRLTPSGHLRASKL